MNRFDASTVWNKAESESPEGEEELPGGEQAFAADHSQLTDDALAFDQVHSAAMHGTAALQSQVFFVPLHYEPNYRYPLIVWLHSDGFNENQVCQVMPHVSMRNYLATGVRAPRSLDSAGHRFEWSHTPAAMEAARRSVLASVQRAANTYNVHPDRIVLAGYRSGGTTALHLAMQEPETFAAAVSLGGGIGSVQGAKLDMARLRRRRLPMLWQMSLESHWYDESRVASDVRTIAGIRTPLEIRQYCNDDEMNTAVLKDLDRWIMDHVVSGAPVGKLNEWDTSPTSFSDN
jgi:phospholipase/carboxylesterase